MRKENPEVIKITKPEDVAKMFEEFQKNKKLKRNLKVVAVVGLGAGLYGFTLGRNSGLRSGFKAGYMSASDEFITALRSHHEDLKASLKGD